MDPRRLLILRHAKSGHPDGVADHERPLSARGRRDAAAVGRWLAERGLRPDLAVVSDATRTRETWEHVVSGLGPTLRAVPARFEREAYDATAEALVALLTEAPEDVGTLLLVGHNPAVEQLAADLDDGTGPEDARLLLGDGLPTSAVAVLEPGGPWTALGRGTARLLEVATPGRS